MTIEFCIFEPTQPFISGVWGNINLAALEEIEREFPEWLQDNEQPSWAASVTLNCVWIPEQRDYENCVDFAGYWEFDVLAVEGFGRRAA